MDLNLLKVIKLQYTKNKRKNKTNPFNVNINRTHLCIKPIVMRSNKHNSMSFASKSVNHPSEQLTTVSYEEACITDYRDEQSDILHDPEDDNLYDPRGRFFPSVDGFDNEEDIEF